MSRGHHDILRQVRSSRIKYVYTALIEIRKSFIKSDKGVEVLVAGGLVERLVELLQTWETLPEQFRSKVTDISASILGNMCMLEVARKQVLKTNGINAIAQLLLSSDSESIQNRCCRCLANILLSPGSWKLVHDTPVIERIIKLLNDTENEECKQTYIRAIRLLGQTGKHVQAILDKKGVSKVSKLLDCDGENVSQSALRCLLSLSTHCCSVEFATQIVSSGKVPYLLTASEEKNEEAIQLIVRLCNLPNFRPEFGNASGINIFVELFKSSDDFFMNLRRDLVDVLSMCCKEAVNRVKLRDSGSLQILVSTLSDEDFSPLHARVISALVCFLYDQSSFDVLLEHGLVNALVKLLNSYMKQCDNSEDDGQSIDKFKQSLNQEESVSDVNSIKISKDNRNHERLVDDGDIGTTTSADKAVPAVAETKINKKHMTEYVNTHVIVKDADTDRPNKGEIKCITQDIIIKTVDIEDEVEGCKKDDMKSDVNAKANHNDTIETITSNRVENKLEINDTFGDNDDKIRVGSPIQRRKQPVYSIDSPTYQPVITWDTDQNSGAKCIERFTPPHDSDYSVPTHSYSPLSNSSYYSPSEGSPEYFCSGTSPQSKTGSEPSPLSRSPAPQYKRNIYTGITSGIGLHLSPDSSPERWKSDGSPPTSPFNIAGSVYNSDTEELSNVSSLISSSSETSGSAHYNQSTDRCSSPVSTNHIDIGEGNQNASDGTANVTENRRNCQDTTSISKAIAMSRKRKKVPNKSLIFENNILILFSRISQTTDPSKHLVTMETMKTLINYIAHTEVPLARAARLLSRIFRNPLCFESLLRLNIPTILFKCLLLDENIKFLMANVLKHRNDVSKRRRSSSKFDTSSDEVSDSDRFSVTCDSPPEEDFHPAKRRRRHSSETKHTQYYKGTYHKQGEAVCNVGRCGIAFLEDLSEVADSSYGTGLVEKMLCEEPGSSKLDLCLTLMYITWSTNSRDFFCKQLIVLDQVLSILRDPQYRHSSVEFTAITGLSLVAQAMDTRTKYRKKGTISAKCKARDSWMKEQSNKQGSCNETALLPKQTKEGTLVKDQLNESNCCSSANQQNKSSHDSMVSLFNKQNFVKSVCVLTELSSHDLEFIIGGDKVYANRIILTKSSDIFTAMLEGNYSEAKLSTITISNTSVTAFKHIVHYLHGCRKGNCMVISYIYDTEVSRNSTIDCIDIITETDKYLMHSVKEEIMDLLYERYIIPESALSVLKFSVLHGHELLQKCAVSSVLVDNNSVMSLLKCVGEILDSSYKNIFLQLLEDMLIE